MRSTKEILEAAKAAAPKLTLADEEKINKALLKIADLLCTREAVTAILAANLKDLERAEGISEVMKDRLRLNEQRIESMASGIRAVANLPSPLGKTISEISRPNGLVIKKVSVGIGVVAIIYESRPNVTSDAAALALKSGNVCILRGGKEAFLTSSEIVRVIRRGLVESGLPEDAVTLVEDTTRQSALELMRANGYVDMLIPRGSAGLIKACVENATVPCIQTGAGICHVYVDRSADLEKALNIIENAKTSRPSVCNAAEVCLVDSAIAEQFLPLLRKRLTDVELRLDERAQKIIDGTPAKETDFDTEFLDYILAVGIVDGVEKAIEHISKHSTHHSEAIIAEDKAAFEVFTRQIDSAAVYVNASTRFTDGGEFGFGCEMGISTQKLHARGPMGLPELTTYKYIITGDGQIR
ncbi:MAG: glutamate-5-semialdehyde dehydrogenase [Clostridia bacterium]|nr:glutamate-5-semialdehyde dehydrogenase [Clostridia bacterium]